MENLEKEFTALFNKIAPHFRRSELFYNFITIFGLEFYQAVYRENADVQLKQRYQTAVSHYHEDERKQLSQLFTIVVNALEQKPYDFLGTVFMALNLGDGYKGQYFTPPHIARTMVAITLTDIHNIIEKRNFITLQEPTCGSGVMIIESYNHLLHEKLNPQQQLWVQAQDLDFTAAMMCYIQMSLLHIPGEVIIGNTLTNETHYHLYTPAHILGNWHLKLNNVVQENEPAMIQVIESETTNDLPFEIDWENELMFY